MRRLLLSAAAVVAMVSAAQAADLPPPPVAVSPWSFSVFGGASWLDPVDGSLDFTGPGGTEDVDSKVNFDTGFIVGGTFGYTFVDWARTEIEISYTGYDVNGSKFYPPSGVEVVLELDDASLGALSLFGNMWLGFNMLPVIGDPVNQLGSSLGGLSPYFGGGLGVAFVDANNGDYNDSTTAFTWQVGAGLRWTFASNIGLDLGYRFRGITDVDLGDLRSSDLYSNNVILGLTFNF